MNGERYSADKVQYRVYSGLINLIVCISCSNKARRLGFALEASSRLRTDDHPGDVLNGDLPLDSAA